MPNTTVDDIRVADGNGDPTSILDAAATAARVRLVDVSGNAVDPSAPATQPVTVVDGGDVALGATSDAAATAGSTGTVSAKLRYITSILSTISSGITSLLSGIVLAAGTNAIGKLAANSGVDIGDVDVLTVNGVAPVFAGVSTGQAATGMQNVIAGMRTTSSLVTPLSSGAVAASYTEHLAVVASMADGGAPAAEQSNQAATLLASAARTATTATSDQTNKTWRGAMCVLNITAVPGVETITPTIQGKDSISGSYYTLLAGAAQVATGLVVLTVYPGVSAIANLAANSPLPRTWRVNVAHSASGSFTYSLSAEQQR